MTLKYESELLFDLMKRDGDDAPSDVLPYESELKEKYLEQVKGAYPKLQDYRAEWLNYNLYLQLPSQFPYENVANVTSASFDNVVPYAYKSVILKGQTLVNVVSSCWFEESTKYFGIELNNYKNSQTYMFIMFNVPNNIKRIYVGNLDGSIIWVDYTKNFIKNKNCIMLKITCPSNYDGTSILPHFQYVDDERPSTINNIECMLIEYQDGMENRDIPYFEGMQWVKMPVLTTSNEDGTKSNILTVNEEVELHGIGDVRDTLDCLTGELNQRIDKIIFNGSEDWKASSWSNQINTIGFSWTGFSSSNQNVISSAFKQNDNFTNDDVECMRVDEEKIRIRINRNKLNGDETVKGFKAYLAKNNITIYYEQDNPTIKTVDLTCINEHGKSEALRPIEGTMHVSTSSQTLPPLLDMTVPVEATTQNLMSFANIVEEE